MATDEDAAEAGFMALEGVQTVLSISRSQAYGLVRSGALRAIQVGGRGQWRAERRELQAYIHRCYEQTAPIVAQENI